MKVLIVVDSPGWAYDYKAESIIKHLAEFNLTKVYFSDFRWSMALENDVVFLMGYFYFNPIEIPEMFKGKVVSTLTSFGFKNSELRKAMFPVLCQFYKRSGAVSPDLLDSLTVSGAPSPVLCMNGVDENKFTKTPRAIGSEKNIKVGFVCSSEDRGFDFKGLESIAKPLFREVACDNHRIDFDPLVVDSFNKARVKTHEQMVEYYHGIDLLISTSHRYSEGTPNPAFEASSCGVPVLSTENGCIRKLVKNGTNGFMVSGWTNKEESVGAREELKNRLIELQENRDLLKQMGDNARSSIEESWTWRDRSKDYIDLFNLNG